MKTPEFIFPVVILMGSNEGDRKGFLDLATHEISTGAGSIQMKSSVYISDSWGNETQPPYLNQCLIIQTFLTPMALMKTLLNMERKMGRVRTTKWASRSIDLDILFYGDQVIHEPDLQIPHPQIPNRRFTLLPLCELIPDFIHPVLGSDIKRLMELCKDPLPVNRI